MTIRALFSEAVATFGRRRVVLEAIGYAASLAVMMAVLALLAIMTGDA